MPVAAIEQEITATIYDATFNNAETTVDRQMAGMLEHKLYLPKNYILSYKYDATGDMYTIDNGGDDYLLNQFQQFSVNLGYKFNLLESMYLLPSIGWGLSEISYDAAPEAPINDGLGPYNNVVLKLDAGINFNKHNLSAKAEVWASWTSLLGIESDFNSITASYSYEYARGFYIGGGLSYITRNKALKAEVIKVGTEKSLSPFIDLKFIF